MSKDKVKVIGWEDSVNKQRQMRKRGAELLYDRVVLLCAIYDCMEFRQWCEDSQTDELDYLDAEIDDTATGFLTWRAILAAHPDRCTWAKSNIRNLIADALEAERQARQAEREKEGKATERISWKERALTAEAECERLRIEVKALTARVEELKEMVGMLSGGKRLVLSDA